MRLRSDDPCDIKGRCQQPPAEAEAGAKVRKVSGAADREDEPIFDSTQFASLLTFDQANCVLESAVSKFLQSRQSRALCWLANVAEVIS